MSVEDSYENRNTLSTSHPLEEICFLGKQMWKSEGWDPERRENSMGGGGGICGKGRSLGV